MELKNSENRTAVLRQVKKAHKEKQIYWEKSRERQGGGGVAINANWFIV